MYPICCLLAAAGLLSLAVQWRLYQDQLDALADASTADVAQLIGLTGATVLITFCPILWIYGTWLGRPWIRALTYTMTIALMATVIIVGLPRGDWAGFVIAVLYSTYTIWLVRGDPGVASWMAGRRASRDASISARGTGRSD